MLIMRVKEGQWIEIKHKSGDVIRVRLCNIRPRYRGRLDTVFDDDAHNFSIVRSDSEFVHTVPPPADPAPGPAPWQPRKARY